MSQTMHSTISSAFLPTSSRAKDVALILSGALLVAVLAQVSIPLKPIPMTLQTLGVLGVGAALGSKRGGAAMATYLVAGAIGLPVFADGASGLGKILGASGGYLIGFLLAAALVGYLVERFEVDRKVVSTALAMLVGNVVIYAIGLPWLAATTGLSGSKLLGAGLTPFILGDLIKIGLAAALLPSIWLWASKK